MAQLTLLCGPAEITFGVYAIPKSNGHARIPHDKSSLAARCATAAEIYGDRGDADRDNHLINDRLLRMRG